MTILSAHTGQEGTLITTTECDIKAKNVTEPAIVTAKIENAIDSRQESNFSMEESTVEYAGMTCRDGEKRVPSSPNEKVNRQHASSNKSEDGNSLQPVFVMENVSKIDESHLFSNSCSKQHTRNASPPSISNNTIITSRRGRSRSPVGVVARPSSRSGCKSTSNNRSASSNSVQQIGDQSSAGRSSHYGGHNGTPSPSTKRRITSPSSHSGLLSSAAIAAGEAAAVAVKRGTSPYIVNMGLNNDENFESKIGGGNGANGGVTLGTSASPIESTSPSAPDHGLSKSDGTNTPAVTQWPSVDLMTFPFFNNSNSYETSPLNNNLSLGCTENEPFDWVDGADCGRIYKRNRDTSQHSPRWNTWHPDYDHSHNNNSYKQQQYERHQPSRLYPSMQMTDERRDRHHHRRQCREESVTQSHGSHHDHPKYKDNHYFYHRNRLLHQYPSQACQRDQSHQQNSDCCHRIPRGSNSHYNHHENTDRKSKYSSSQNRRSNQPLFSEHHILSTASYKDEYDSESGKKRKFGNEKVNSSTHDNTRSSASRRDNTGDKHRDTHHHLRNTRNIALMNDPSSNAVDDRFRQVASLGSVFRGIPKHQMDKCNVVPALRSWEEGDSSSSDECAIKINDEKMTSTDIDGDRDNNKTLMRRSNAFAIQQKDCINQESKKERTPMPNELPDELILALDEDSAPNSPFGDRPPQDSQDNGEHGNKRLCPVSPTNIDKELSASGFEVDNLDDIMQGTSVDGEYSNLCFRKSYDLEQMFSFMRSPKSSMKDASGGTIDLKMGSISFTNSFGVLVSGMMSNLGDEKRKDDCGNLRLSPDIKTMTDKVEIKAHRRHLSLFGRRPRHTQSPLYSGEVPTIDTLTSQASSLGITPINSLNDENCDSALAPFTSIDGLTLRAFFSSSPTNMETVSPRDYHSRYNNSSNHQINKSNNQRKSRHSLESGVADDVRITNDKTLSHVDCFPPNEAYNHSSQQNQRCLYHSEDVEVALGTFANGHPHSAVMSANSAGNASNKRVRLLSNHHSHARFDIAKRSDVYVLLKLLAPAFSGFQFKLPQVNSPVKGGNTINIQIPTEYHMAVAKRRIFSSICAFGGCVPHRTVSIDSETALSISPIKENEDRISYEKNLSSRYYMKENCISWDVELHDVSFHTRDGGIYAKSKQDFLSSKYSTPVTPITPNNAVVNGSDSLGLSRERGQKIKYRCKLCGQPKQNHTCPYQSTVMRSIGTMVYPAVNAFVSDEPGRLAPALSEMNNFTSLLSQDVSTPGSCRDYRTFTGYNVMTPDSHWSPNTPGGQSTLSTPSTPGALTTTGALNKNRDHLLMSRTMSGVSTAGGTTNDACLFRDIMELKPEQYRKVRLVNSTNSDAYCYPHIPNPYLQRKEMGDTLFAFSREVPKLADACAAILREARENDKWDQAVAELMTQVLIVIKCEEQDYMLEGLRRHLLTLGIAC